MKSGSLNISGMPYRRSGHAGGKSVSMISMLMLLMAALLVLPSCFDDDTETVRVTETKIICENGDEVDSADDCRMTPTTPPPVEPMCDGEAIAGELLEGGDPDDVLCGSEGNDEIDGGGGSDTITGNAGNDILRGGTGPDMISGGPGNDNIDGGPGGDSIDAGEGNDDITGGGGSNEIDGGDGTDIAAYLRSARVRVDLSKGTAQHFPMTQTFDNRGGDDTLANIENVKGSHGNDVINGDDGPNLLKGLDGMDTINGHGGDDTILPNRPAGPMGVANVSDLNPEEGGDPIPANDQSDKVNGGAGTDTISYEGEAEAVTIDLSQVVPATTGDSAVPAHYAATVNSVVDMIAVDDKGTEDTGDDVSTIENIVGGTNGDDLTGNSGNNSLKGLAGNDNIDGGPGDDTIDGGLGDDTIDGGMGNDMIYADAGDTIDGGMGISDTNDPATDFDDTTDGDTDTVSYANIKATKDGTMGVTKTLGTDLTDIEVLIGSPNNDTLGGDDTTDDTIMGGGGVDTLTGGGGDDTLNGGPGMDTLTGGVGADVFVVFSGESSGDKADRVTDYMPDEINSGGVVTTKGDEIHLKNFSSQTAVVSIASATNVQVSVAGTVVLNITATTGATAPEAIKKDLEKAGKIVFVTTN